MKRIFAFFLAMVLVLGAVPAHPVHASELEDIPTEETVPVTEETEAPTEPEYTLREQTAAPDPGLPDNAELFDAYAQQVLYGSSFSLLGTAAGERLTGDAKLLYDAIVPILKQIAAGQRESAVIGIGKTVSYGGETYTADASATFSSTSLSENTLGDLVDALLSDLPYEMYWYDKVTGCKLQTLSTSTQIVHVRLRFAVADNYSTGDDYTADVAKTGAAVEAAAGARSIVSAYASKSDYDKLLGYKAEICDLVSYDHAAASSGSFSADNDPWQLIHVFDGDTGTNVVCEGYSKAFMYLCDLTAFSGDVTCYTVTGNAGGPHMWNIVSIAGRNYLVDVTNSDSGTIGQDGSLFLTGTAGSPADGYTLNGLTYTYDDDTKNLWGTGTDSILSLAGSAYDPDADPCAQGHSYASVVTAPTCTEGGYTTYTCSVCGDSYTDNYTKATGHTYDAAVTAPTCTEKGYTTYTCACGDSYIADEVDALGHDMGQWVVTEDATCEKDGQQRRDCSRCDYFETAVIKASGHSYSTVVTAPTCTEKGYTTYTCACGDSYIADEVAALGHDMGQWVVTEDATCEKDGQQRRDCSRCDYFETAVINASGHSYSSVVTAPTCTEKGYTTYTCACGDSYIADEVAALGHDMGQWVVTEDATCEKDGQQRRDCSRCDFFETAVINASGHSYSSVVTAPTCTEKGYTTYTCSVCGDSYTTDEVAALGHSMGEWVVTEDATCTEAGSKERYCQRGCGYSETAQTKPSGHSYNSSVTAPTCTEDGCITYMCEYCGDSYTEKGEAALGHDMGAWVADGTQERRDCNRCDYYETRELILEETAPEAPTVKIANIASSGKIKLTWEKVEGAAKYKVYRATSKTGTYSLLKTTTGTSLSNTSAVAGKQYYYYVVAVGENGAESEKSSIVTRVCDLPQPVLKATNVDSTGKIKLTWNKIDGAESYKVYRSTSKTTGYTLLKTTTGTSLTNTSVEVGTRYYYKVYALHESNSSANSAYSSVVNRTCDLPKPVVKISVVSSTGKLKLSWEKIEGAKNYSVYRSVDGGETYTLLKTTTGTALTNTSVTAGNKYYYKVKANHTNSAANSAYSDVKSGTCDLPRPVVKVTNVASSGKPKLSWEKIQGATGYKVYRATGEDGTYTLLKTTTGTSLTNTSTEAGVQYYYKVLATHSNSAANSAYSQVVTRVCDLPRPTLTVSNVASTGKLKLTWTAVAGAVKYQVYRSDAEDGTYTLLKTTTGTSLTNTSVISGTTYYYKVRAIASNTSANSAYSAVKSATAGLGMDDTFVTSYVLTPNAYIYRTPSDSGEAIILKYMDEVQVGTDVSVSATGKWTRIRYQGSIYYTWIPVGVQKFTTVKSSFQYESSSNTALQNSVIKQALTYKDLPTYYTHDASTGQINEENGKYGFDCSGFVSYVINTVIQKENPLYKLDKNITTLYNTGTSANTTGILYNSGYPNSFTVQTVRRENMQPGDVIFFKVDDSDTKAVDHCGIYLGNNEFIHAAALHDGVCIMPLSGSFAENFVSVRRYYPAEVLPANQTMATNYGYVYLYAQRDDASQRLYSFSLGEEVTLLFTSTNDTWGYVRNRNGLEGYVLMKRFDPVG